eukprot:TRINITY_DN3669_c0_g1_i1.p1 TRINITY_DN3669_c0_g1~~TRINITY_DN3669_c0_g1_i1.p1  ORF type:complete len:363 (+),score=51.36 TRINITY_DN3669_c0_g1_i1:18-1106(+)
MRLHKSNQILLFFIFFDLVLSARHWGATFGAGEWSNVDYTYSTPQAFESLNRLKQTGANWVRLLMTWYQDSINATRIYPIQPPSYLATPTDQEIIAITKQAKSLGLKVMFSPIVDPNWEIKGNIRGGPGETNRLEIGTYFTEQQWEEWFSSYANYINHYANLATIAGADMFAIASELVTAFKRTQDWRNIISGIRKQYNGLLTVAGETDQELPFWDSLDFIGIDAYFVLNTVSDHPNVDELKASWQPHILLLEQWSKKYNKSVLFTEVGYCSAFRSHAHPWAMELVDGEDCSVWYLCVDLKEQANCYTALLESFTSLPWWEGVFWWLWRTDPSDGGTSDPGFSPVGKPAEKIITDWYHQHTV